MVMSQDGDAIMFGSQMTLRDWSKEGSRGNKAPTHLNLLDLPRVKQRSGLDPEGMILVALLSGGDYDQDGVSGFGAALACEAARAGFGTDLLELIRKDDEVGLAEWRERLQYELETNESGYFKRRHKTLKIPDSFPNRTLVSYYVDPAVSKDDGLKKLERKLEKSWDEDINIPELRGYVGDTFDWLYKPGAWKFVRSMAPPLLAHTLHRGLPQQHVTSVDQIKERRQHFTNDGIPELRVAAIPADVIGLDLEAEEDSPEYLARLAEEQEQEQEEVAADGEPLEEIAEGIATIQSSQQARKVRKRPPWNPHDLEKMWIPETVLQLGVPALVEQWQENEREKLADPKKFATRKCKKTAAQAAKPSQSSRIEHYFAPSKPPALPRATETSTAGPVRPPRERDSTPTASTPIKKQAEISLPSSSPSIRQFFTTTKAVSQETSEKAEASKEEGTKLLIVPPKHSRPSSSDTSLSKKFESGESRLRRGAGTSMNALAVAPSKNGSGSSPQIAPSTPQKDMTPRLGEDVAELPDSVTRRKKHSRRRKVVSGTERTTKTLPRPTKPEGVFESRSEGERAAPNRQRRAPTEDDRSLPADPGTGLKVGFIHKKVYALPRDSLPGTWKNVDLDEEVMSVKAKRVARISYIDMAKD